MSWKTIRLELGRTKDHPEGSPAFAYVLHLPLGEDGVIDTEAFAAAPTSATVRRIWSGEPDQHGHVVRKRGGGFALSYAPGEDDDEPVWHLTTHALTVGNYVTITEVEGEALPFKVVSCHG
jgi:hypothetical protein